MNWVPLKNDIIRFATSHPQINSIGFGDPLAIGTDNVINIRTPDRDRIMFPLLFADLQSSTIGMGTSTLNCSILIMDQVRDSKQINNYDTPAIQVTGLLANRWNDVEDEILNDMESIFLDFISHFTDNPDIEYSMNTNITINRFIEGRDDKLAGWQGTLGFVFPFSRNVCQIPTI